MKCIMFLCVIMTCGTLLPSSKPGAKSQSAQSGHFACFHNCMYTKDSTGTYPMNGKACNTQCNKLWGTSFGSKK